ncbi:L-lactate permease, partial [Salmonella enterica subsp. enterica serovar Montevideo]|nr:L-lactate permease [Salmonella enterica subsp. enterica serovar Montevideo]
LLFYKMPVDHALASVVYGFFYGLWPIAWIIIAAVFVYKISVKIKLTLLQQGQLSIPQPQQRPATDRPLLPAEHNTLNQLVTKLAAA